MTLEIFLEVLVTVSASDLSWKQIPNVRSTVFKEGSLLDFKLAIRIKSNVLSCDDLKSQVIMF